MSELDNIKDIPITDVARLIGLNPIKVGRYYSLSEHDSVRIDPKKNLFIRNSTGQKGSVIDFVMAFTGLDIKESIRFLKRESGFDAAQASRKRPVKEENKIDFTLPEKDTTLKNVFAYLINTRKIDSEIVKEFVEEKFLYQDKNKNCVFVSYKNKTPVFANKRGTNTYKKFVGDVYGSDYSHCFFIDNASRHLIITESVIDAMSVMNIIKTEEPEKSYKKFNYLALCGVSKFERALKNHMQNEYSSVILCMDNDLAGIKASEDIKKYIKNDLEKDNTNVFIALPPEGDYNDYLKSLVSSSNIIKESVGEYAKKSNPLKFVLNKMKENQKEMLYEKIKLNFPAMTHKDVNAAAGLIESKFNDFVDFSKLWNEVKSGKLYHKESNWEITCSLMQTKECIQRKEERSYEISYQGEEAIFISSYGDVEFKSGFVLSEDKNTIIDILNEKQVRFEEFADKKILDEKIILKEIEEEL